MTVQRALHVAAVLILALVILLVIRLRPAAAASFEASLPYAVERAALLIRGAGEPAR